MIIGLTGKNASGKSQVAEFLKEAGFEYYSLSDAIRDELRAKQKTITRDLLIETGNQLRRSYGPTVLASRILTKLEVDKNYVVDSFRNPKEVELFKTQSHFHLLHVSAKSDLRFERMRERAREGDPQDLTGFEKLELEEAANTDENGQQLDATSRLADVELENNGSIEELRESVKNIIRNLAFHQKRPGWDEYFLNIAKVVALRSNCIKRKVAALIVKDQRIISTGYNGTPRGLQNCNEGGCPRCNHLGGSGLNLEECFCSHAEENAITQSAYHGVNIKGSALYTTYSPCLLCTKMIINAGILEVVYNQSYPLGDSSFKLFAAARVRVRRIELI